MRLMRKILLPALLLAPSPASGYGAGVILENKAYSVKVSENRKLIEVRPNDARRKRVSSIAFIKHERRLLELGLNGLNYGIYELGKDSISSSKNLSSRIKTMGDFLNTNVSIPWQTLALMKMDAKILACKEVWPNRAAARSLLNSIDLESDPAMLNEYYGKIQDMMQIIDFSSNLIRDVRESTDIRFAITEKEISNLKDEAHYANITWIEGLWDSVKSRYSKSANDVITGRFYQSEQYGNYLKSLSRMRKGESLDKILERYSSANPSKILFRNSYPVSLETQSQYDVPLKTSMEVLIERSLERSGEHNLDITLSTKDSGKEKGWADAFVLNKSKNSLFVFYPSDYSIGDSEQGIYSLKSDAKSGEFSGTLEEVFPSGKDRKISMKMEFTEFAFKKAVGLISPNNITRVNNIMDWIAKKILEYNSGKLEKQKGDFMERLSTDYSVKEIPLYPIDSQFSSLSVSLPVGDQEAPIYLMINVGIQDWEQRSTGQLENIIIEIKNDGASEKKEEMIIPPRWLENIGAFCSRYSDGRNYSALRSLPNDAPSFLQGETGRIIDRIVGKESVNYICKKDELIQGINKEVMRIKRKDYGWIISEPFVKIMEDGMISVMTSYPKREYSTLNPSNDIPNNIGGALRDVADIDFIRRSSLEKIGSAYCSLNLSTSGHSYDCYLPALFDENSFHVEFLENIGKLKMINLSPLDNIYVSTKISFEKGKEKID